VETRTKDPDARLDYAVDWTAFLDGTNDQIDSAEWVDYDYPDLTIEDEGVEGNLHTCFVSGGTVGRAYHVTSRVTTTEGRINDTTFIVFVRQT
jgi:hypothetical protein